MIPSALSIIGGVLGAAVLLYAAFNLARASDLRTTVADQQARIKGLVDTREELKSELKDERAERALLEKRLELIESRCQQLEEIVAGRVDFSALETEIVSFAMELTRLVAAMEKQILDGQRDIKALLKAQRATDGD